MTPEEKLQFMHQLAKRLSWCVKVMLKSGHDDDNLSTVILLSVNDDTDDGAPAIIPGSVVDNDQATAMLTELQDHYKGNLRFLDLRYSFKTGRLLLDVEDDSAEPNRPSHIAPEVLRYISEEQIRQAFAQHDAWFFKKTKTTPSDWRLPALDT